MIVDSTLLEVLHPRQVKHSASFDGAGWVRWGTFNIYGVKLHLLCSTVSPSPTSLHPPTLADVSLIRELIGEAGLEATVGSKLFGDLAYRSGRLQEEELVEVGISLVSDLAQQRPTE
jgi:hypothetical protein